MTGSQAETTPRRRQPDHNPLSVRHVRNSLKLGASCETRRDVCLTPPVDNVLISADWMILWLKDGIDRRGTVNRARR
jgi:hypothetical protein